MKKRVRKLLMAIFCLLVFIFFASTVQAETIDCTPITSLPSNISIQGVYCLTGHLQTNLAAGNAITINVNNVVIDMNGFKIGNLAAGPNTLARGIYADKRKSITIKNGTIRGFFVGILLDDVSPFTTSQVHVVQNIRADKNYYRGIITRGSGNVIKNNTVVDTGGSTFFNSARGILAVGPDALIKDNILYETKEKTGGSAHAIYISNGDGTMVWNNTVENAATGPGTSFGIFMCQSDNVLVRNNNVTTMDFGIDFSGIFCASTGKYMGNLTSDCTTPFRGGIDAGDNS